MKKKYNNCREPGRASSRSNEISAGFARNYGSAVQFVPYSTGNQNIQNYESTCCYMFLLYLRHKLRNILLLKETIRELAIFTPVQLILRKAVSWIYRTKYLLGQSLSRQHTRDPASLTLARCLRQGGGGKVGRRWRRKIKRDVL